MPYNAEHEENIGSVSSKWSDKELNFLFMIGALLIGEIKAYCNNKREAAASCPYSIA